MSQMTQLTKTLLLAFVFTAAGCGEDQANAQTNPATRAQIRENLGDAPSRIDTTTAYRLSAAFRGAAERALPAVVRISVTVEPRVAQGQRNQRIPLDRLFPGFPDLDTDEPSQRGGRGSGSGFVFDARGYILTNHHVVANADRVLVTMVDGREYNATVVGSDPNTDVAVVKIETSRGEQLTPVEFGSSDDLHVGDWVIALGNPLNLQFTVTQGIVSAKGRNLNILNNQTGTGLEAFIQTDAVINPGNSGGPMIDLTGKVVGINSAIESSTGYWAGNGFAIPIDLARKVANDILEFGRVRRPRLGVSVGPVSAADAEVYRLPTVAGAVITGVDPKLAGARAGIEMGDVVVALNGQPIRSQTEFMEELARQRPGQNVKLGIIRYGQRLDKTVALGEFDVPAAQRAERPSGPRSKELLGFEVRQITPEIAQALQTDIRSGVVISSIDPLGSAATAGFNLRGTVLRKINGRAVNTVEEVERAAAALRAGQVVTLVIRTPRTEYDTMVNYRVR